MYDKSFIINFLCIIPTCSIWYLSALYDMTADSKGYLKIAILVAIDATLDIYLELSKQEY